MSQLNNDDFFERLRQQEQSNAVFREDINQLKESTQETKAFVEGIKKNHDAWRNTLQAILEKMQSCHDSRWENHCLDPVEGQKYPIESCKRAIERLIREI